MCLVATDTLHLLRIMSSVIFFGSPPSMAELGNDGNDMPGGLSMARWKLVGVGVGVEVEVAMAVNVSAPREVDAV